MPILPSVVVACISFVIVSSQRQPIRAIMSGATASSTVRRHPRQSAFLRRVGSQTRVIKLQGFLFFGTVVKVEAKIRDLLEEAAWHLAPIRFLLVDFSLASGVDFSAAEAFLRIQRLLQVKNVILVVCGCSAESPVGKALNNVDLFSGDENLVRVFSTLNDALEVRQLQEGANVGEIELTRRLLVPALREQPASQPIQQDTRAKHACPAARCYQCRNR